MFRIVRPLRFRQIFKAGHQYQYRQKDIVVGYVNIGVAANHPP
jgi:hypothetical protein